MALVNACLSPRSEARHRKLNGFTPPFLSLLKAVCAQAPEHAKSWEELGMSREGIEVTGSLKFDPGGQEAPARRPEFEDILKSFGDSRLVVLLASTHGGEEALLASSFAGNTEELLVVVPRHAERLASVRADLESLGFEIILRTDFKKPETPGRAILWQIPRESFAIGQPMRKLW